MSDNERMAVLEHRTEQNEKTLLRVEAWMQSLTENMTEMVRLQANMVHMDRSIQRLHERMDKEEAERIRQHKETATWASKNSGLQSEHSSWISWFKLLLIGAVGALIGGAMNHLVKVGGAG